MGKYRAGALSGASFAVACCVAVAASRWRGSADPYLVIAALGGLVAFTVTTRMHGRRGAPGGAGRALVSTAFGWAAAIAALTGALAVYVVVIAVMSGY